jgi:predicted secreted protein
MRTEISQAKKEAAHFQLSLEKSQKIQKFKRKQQLQDVMADQGFQVPQRKLESEHKKKPKQKEQRTKLLSNLFGANKK